MPSLDMPVFSAPQAMAGVSISAIAAIATDRCLLRGKDKISHPSIVANDNGLARLSVARPDDAKRFGGMRTIRFKCGCGCLLSGKASRAWSIHGGQ